MVRLTVDNFDYAIILSLNHFCKLITDIASHSVLIQNQIDFASSREMYSVTFIAM